MSQQWLHLYFMANFTFTSAILNTMKLNIKNYVILLSITTGLNTCVVLTTIYGLEFNY